MNYIDDLIAMGFLTEPILDGEVLGLRITPTSGITNNYFEQWIVDKGDQWVLNLVDQAGFLVLDHNCFLKEKRWFLGMKKPLPMWKYFGQVYSDPRSLFWHRELDVNIDSVLREESIDVGQEMVEQYVNDPLRAGIFFLHYNGPIRFGRGHAHTGVVNKKLLSPATIQVARGIVSEEVIGKIDKVVNILEKGIAERELNPDDFEPLYADVVNLLLGCHPQMRHSHPALLKTKQELGNNAYWHNWSSVDQTLVISNRRMAHSRLVYDSRKMDTLERGVLLFPL
ncbi:MAG TPA: hypothetical protein VJI98_02795 [Candidatus Nanoarchaeia archaeon]|nr:hypothetical protein [Candidatus Nanoarchaeia archaeon]